MKTPSQQLDKGIIAILDALGASTFGDEEINRFIDSRQIVLDLLDSKIQGVFGDVRFTENMVSTFTFNDTILIVLRTGHEPTWGQIGKFFTVMRKFFVDSLTHRILFRGSIAIGDFYAHDESNTVLGKAVTDAAAWYDKADWVGILATPRTSMLIQQRVEKSDASKSHVILDYEVPLKDGKTICVKAVNWPKVFFVEGITPCRNGEKPKEKLLEFLPQHQVPLGTERKFSNTLAFFDFAVKETKKVEKKARAVRK